MERFTETTAINELSGFCGSKLTHQPFKAVGLINIAYIFRRFRGQPTPIQPARPHSLNPCESKQSALRHLFSLATNCLAD